MTTKITQDELKELDSRLVSLLKKVAPSQFESLEDPIELANKRRSAIEELKTLKERKKRLPALQKDADEKFEKVKIAKAEYKRIGKIYNEARNLFNAEAEAVTMGIERCEKTLMKTSSKELRKRLAEIKAEAKALRETVPVPVKIKNAPFPSTNYQIITTYGEIVKKINSLKSEMQKTITEMLNEGVE